MHRFPAPEPPQLESFRWGLRSRESPVAEARAALAATGAGALGEIADTHELSINTVKSQLQQVYAKTGAKGRAELVRLILGMASAGD